MRAGDVVQALVDRPIEGVVKLREEGAEGLFGGCGLALVEAGNAPPTPCFGDFVEVAGPLGGDSRGFATRLLDPLLGDDCFGTEQHRKFGRGGPEVFGRRVVVGKGLVSTLVPAAGEFGEVVGVMNSGNKSAVEADPFGSDGNHRLHRLIPENGLS